MKDDVMLNKVSVIERCIRRILDVYDDNPNSLVDFTKQDSIVLNLQRACEASIDLAMHIVAEKKYGIPQNSRDGFELLLQHGIITEETANVMKAMVGFRNIAVHDYQTININILQKIVETHLQDFHAYTSQVITNAIDRGE